jgi:hypothetical protein
MEGKGGLDKEASFDGRSNGYLGGVYARIELAGC